MSEWYLVRRGDRQSCLEVDPPLLLREDVKIEFHVKPRVDMIKPKFMQSKKVRVHKIVAHKDLDSFKLMNPSLNVYDQRFSICIYRNSISG